MSRAELVRRGRRLEWFTLSWNLVEAWRGEACCEGECHG
jgi:hypothetical protein